MSETGETLDGTARILVVEDDASDLELLTLLLGGWGYEVVCAGTLAEALVKTKAHAPALLILDERLPDGLASQSLDHLRAHAPGAPVVFISGHLDLGTALQLSQQGVAAIFTKPVKPQALAAKLGELLASRASRAASNASSNPPAAKGVVAAAPGPGSRSPVPAVPAFRWTQLSGRCAAYQRLAGQLAKVCDFRSHLLLLGPPCAAFFPFVRELHANSTLRAAPLLLVTPAGFRRESLLAALQSLSAANETQPLTLSLERIDCYDPAQAALLHDLIHFRADFAPWSGRLRSVLSALPTLTEEGAPSALPGDLVERLAVLTVNLPAFAALRDDWVGLARHILARPGSAAPDFEESAVRWLEAPPWPGGYRQFRRVLLVSAAASGETPLTPDLLDAAYALEPTLPDDAYDETGPALPPSPPATAPAIAEPAPPPEPTPATPTEPAPPPATKRRPRVGSYDFSSRLNSILETAPDAPAPSAPVHPRFAPKNSPAS